VARQKSSCCQGSQTRWRSGWESCGFIRWRNANSCVEYLDSFVAFSLVASGYDKRIDWLASSPEKSSAAAIQHNTHARPYFEL
jgi:hypothetical protein